MNVLDGIQRSLPWLLHALIAALLVLVLFQATHWSTWVLAAVFATLYSLRGPLPLVLVAWALLLFDSAEAAYLAFPLFFVVVRAYPPVRALVVIAGMTLVAVITLGHHLGWGVGVVTGPTVGAGVAWVLGVGLRSYEQTVQELVDARADALEASRRAGEEGERARIAVDLHDTVAQGLASIQMLLRAAEPKVTDPEARGHLELARETTSENLTETRRIIAALQPTPLVGAELPVALARVCSTTPMGDRVSFVVDGTARVLPEPVEHALVRVVQSLVANVVRHAEAESARVTLTYQDDGVRVDVVDNGRGFDSAAYVGAKPQPGSLGLPGARKRAEDLGGHLSVESTPGHGTGVSVWIPEKPQGEENVQD